MMATDKPVCSLCGEPMQEGETMFKYHGSLGPCPKPPLPRPPTEVEQLRALLNRWREAAGPFKRTGEAIDKNFPDTRADTVIYTADPAKRQGEYIVTTQGNLRTLAALVDETDGVLK